MSKITLPRSGDRPLRFEGEEIASVSSRRLIAGQEANRWHELSLYRANGGQLVLSITYKTLWQGELDHSYVVICQDEDDVTAELRSYDPNAYVKGFPGYTESQRIKENRRRRDLQERYDHAVSELLNDLPEELA